MNESQLGNKLDIMLRRNLYRNLLQKINFKLDIMSIRIKNSFQEKNVVNFIYFIVINPIKLSFI